ncbi:MAG: DUF1028 domain-containing protein [Gemmatimonadales bacterium]|nr:MAG: DUF1028 domain-containing protein [Gemmatimonadales bacterium]
MHRGLVVGLAALALAPSPARAQERPLRPVSTYSIVARDSATGELGVAVQSHWFSVGPLVPWAEAGVGAVATQSFIEPGYGPLGLELMRLGRTAPEALKALVSTDADSMVRQVAMIDAQGRVAAHTGSRSIQAAGQRVGAQYSVQANLMERPTVWDAMARAYETASGDLADRLLAALIAAEGEGGDIRGRQSAALLVVRGSGTGRPWVDRRFDLRVEDHPDPVGELRRLVRLARAYEHLNEGDAHVTQNDLERALVSYGKATTLVPDNATNGEAAFWTGVTLAGAGRVDEGVAYLARAYRSDARWAALLRQLPAAGLLPADSSLVERLVRGMRGGN